MTRGDRQLSEQEYYDIAVSRVNVYREEAMKGAVGDTISIFARYLPQGATYPSKEVALRLQTRLEAYVRQYPVEGYQFKFWVESSSGIVLLKMQYCKLAC